ncbi:hypothetical protein CE005_22950 [Salmonella enterica subsp. enterica serovar Mississippi]|nr:hypothetical protein [Salmonella enterica subsp. enterica serovar Mississippi]EIO6136514.1 hypothetical protein [Salmonella enterica]EJT2122728.1 hypothetical protein [Salmonella enterica]
MTYSKNIIPGHGRTKGSLNKLTIERTEALRDYLLKNNVAYKFLDAILDRLENTPEKVKVQDLIKGFQMVQVYLFKSISEQEASERIDQIMDSGNPAQMKAEILDFVTKLKAV